MKHLLAIALCLAALTSCAERKQTYSNPVYPGNRPDPTAIYSDEDNCYYSCATGWNTSFLKSSDLIHWEETDIRPFSKETVAAMREYGHDCWAPQFAEIGGKYLLYMTIRSSAPDSRIAVAQADKVTGPYVFKGIITDGLETGIADTIDPFAFTDPGTGRVWLAFGSVGGIHIVELTPDGLAVKDDAGYRHIAGCKVEDDPSRLTVFEGSYVYRKDGWWYLFASAGRYNDYSYAIVVGRSRNPEGPYLDREGNDMADGHAEVILSSSPYDKFYGPGHNGEIFTSPDGGEYIIYHVHQGDYRQDRLSGGYIPRVMNLQQIYWGEDGWPYFDKNEMAGGSL